MNEGEANGCFGGSQVISGAGEGKPLKQSCTVDYF